MNIADDLVKAFNDGYKNGTAEAGEKISKLERELRQCRNELCLRCGDYKQRHLGACGGLAMAEKEYIEREAAIESFRKNLDGGYVLTNDAQTTHILQSLPAADVRPVVLCRDCKWYQIDELKKDGTEDRRYKPSVCVLDEQRRDPNHFCACGKKREES